MSLHDVSALVLVLVLVLALVRYTVVRTELQADLILSHLALTVLCRVHFLKKQIAGLSQPYVRSIGTVFSQQLLTLSLTFWCFFQYFQLFHYSCYGDLRSVISCFKLKYSWLRMLIPAVQQRFTYTHTHTHTHILFLYSFPLWFITGYYEYGSLRYAVGPCCLSILCVSSANRKPLLCPSPTPLASTGLLSASLLLSYR